MSITTYGPTSWMSARGVQNTASAAVGQSAAGVNVQQKMPNGSVRSLHAGGVAVSGGVGLGGASTTVNPDGSMNQKASGVILTPYGVAGATGSKHTTSDGSYYASGKAGLGAVVNGVGVGAVGHGTQTYDAQTGTKTTNANKSLGVMAPSAGVLGATSQRQTVTYADGSYNHQRNSLLGATNGVDAIGIQSSTNRSKTSDGTVYDSRQVGVSTTFSEKVFMARDVEISPTGQMSGTRTGPGGQTSTINRQNHRPQYWLK